MKEILAATHNAHKLCELRAILAPVGVEVLGGSDVEYLPEVIEDGLSFEENSAKKATETATALGKIVFADDSGLCVDCLDGAPGIYSARYAGENATSDQLMDKLLREMAATGSSDRTARFVCVVSLASPDGLIGQVRGEVKGRILFEKTGEGGFGYDPLFVPDGHTRTFAQMSDEEKNSLSHRKAAMFKAIEKGLFSN